MADNQNLGEQWQALCDDYEEARKAYWDAQVGPIAKMTAMARGEASTNPTIAELNALDVAKKRWDEAYDLLTEFCRKHA